jgi:hypothetical protein
MHLSLVLYRFLLDTSIHGYVFLGKVMLQFMVTYTYLYDLTRTCYISNVYPPLNVL